MVRYKRKDPEEKKKELEELTKGMEEQIQSYFQTPEQMKQYLGYLGQFHNYSSRNFTLIQNQFPGAQAVASFDFWKKKGFSVQKGEKGIKILVPNRTLPKFQDAEGNWKSVKQASKVEAAKIEKGTIKPTQGRLYFSIGNVFDVSQTSATTKDLPEIFPNKWLEGKVENYDLLREGMDQIASNNKINIIKPLSELGAAKGVSYSDLKAVALNPRNSQLQNVKTLIHELAHAKLHTKETRDNYTAPEKEFQAEMTAYAVSAHFGIDTTDYSLGYLAGWTKGKNFEDKEKLLNEVHQTAHEFISTIEEVIDKKKGVSKEVIQEIPKRQVAKKEVAELQR